MRNSELVAKSAAESVSIECVPSPSPCKNRPRNGTILPSAGTDRILIWEALREIISRVADKRNELMVAAILDEKFE